MDEYNPQLKITGTNTDYTLTYTVHYDKIKGRATGFELYSFVSCESTESVTGNYTYDDEGRLASINYGGAWSEEYTYDSLGRTVGILNGNYPNERQDFTFGYQTINGYETNRLVRITDNTYQGSDSTATYDTNGYITGITYADQTHTYEYDALGRLTKETINGTPTTYTYDSANNIISKTVNGTSKNFTYDNNLLDTYGTYSFDYDLMGNPTTYKGNTFVWKQGRKLASGTMNGKSFTYTYDPNGMRYKKKVGNVTTNYYYSGTQLLMEDRGGGADRIYYIYGASGISGMILQEDYAQYTYYFDKNTLGDIIAIRNSNGDVVARYTYDAWGNHKVLKASGTTDTNQSSIGNINPFRYRGYYYDTETGFYYLQTRYYDPTICRFINADNYELVADLASVPGQLNMYAYCGNNPIMHTDETGEFWNWIIGATVGAIFGAVDALRSGENVIAGAIIGGLSGGLIAGLGGGFICTSIISSVANMATDFVNLREINVKEAVASGLIAGGLSFISTQAIGLINNDFFANLADEIFSNTGGMIFESIIQNASRIITKRKYNPFSFKIGIARFY